MRAVFKNRNGLRLLIHPQQGLLLQHSGLADIICLHAGSKDVEGKVKNFTSELELVFLLSLQKSDENNLGYHFK